MSDNKTILIYILLVISFWMFLILIQSFNGEFGLKLFLLLMAFYGLLEIALGRKARKLLKMQ